MSFSNPDKSFLTYCTAPTFENKYLFLSISDEKQLATCVLAYIFDSFLGTHSHFVSGLFLSFSLVELFFSCLKIGFFSKIISKANISANFTCLKSISRASSPCQAGIIKLCLISFKESSIFIIMSSILFTKVVHHTDHLGQDGINCKHIDNILSVSDQHTFFQEDKSFAKSLSDLSSESHQVLNKSLNQLIEIKVHNCQLFQLKTSNQYF
jgi:hypothetical protein